MHHVRVRRAIAFPQRLVTLELHQCFVGERVDAYKTSLAFAVHSVYRWEDALLTAISCYPFFFIYIDIRDDKDRLRLFIYLHPCVSAVVNFFATERDVGIRKNALAEKGLRKRSSKRSRYCFTSSKTKKKKK